MSLLDERQRRLFAALESLRIGRGGDEAVARATGMDPHTIAKGRQELHARDRARRPGGGRKCVKKNAGNSRRTPTADGARHRGRSHHRTTKTQTGLRVKASLNKFQYLTGVKPSSQEMKNLKLIAHELLPKWNYTLAPRASIM
ncbi:MAG: hypothetical protein NT154_06305 [Verrucomicrobia bacterium]|nr:hypothetical protein [Verrucomicrobiota bacterium]